MSNDAKMMTPAPTESTKRLSFKLKGLDIEILEMFNATKNKYDIKVGIAGLNNPMKLEFDHTIQTFSINAANSVSLDSPLYVLTDIGVQSAILLVYYDDKLQTSILVTNDMYGMDVETIRVIVNTDLSSTYDNFSRDSLYANCVSINMSIKPDSLVDVSVRDRAHNTIYGFECNSSNEWSWKERRVLNCL